MSELSEWSNFYVIVGSAAGALIGLQFVVMTLIVSMPRSGADAQAGSAFATPSVVHFGAALLISAIASAPWHEISTIALVWGAGGFIGVVYTAIVVRRMRAQRAYQAVFEDWLFHAVFPGAAYVLLAAAGIIATMDLHMSLLLVGGASLLLLFVGIHNAWDAITFHIFTKRHGQGERDH